MENLEKIYKSTEKIIDIALQRSMELNIKDFVIVSCTGRAIEIFLKKT